MDIRKFFGGSSSKPKATPKTNQSENNNNTIPIDKSKSREKGTSNSSKKAKEVKKKGTAVITPVKESGRTTRSRSQTPQKTEPHSRPKSTPVKQVTRTTPVKKSSSKKEQKPRHLCSGKHTKITTPTKKSVKKLQLESFDNVISAASPQKDNRKTNGHAKSRKRKHLDESSDEEQEEFQVQRKTKANSKKTKKTKKMQIIDSDDEVDDQPKKRGKRKKSSLDSDGESRPPVKKEGPMDVFLRTSPRKSTQPTKPTAASATPIKKKEISAADFFGTSSVKREEKKPTTLKKKTDVEDDVEEIHDDDDFQKTLEQLNETDVLKDTPIKKRKGEDELIIEDTPDRKRPKRSCTTPVKIIAETPKVSPKKTPVKSKQKTPVKTDPKDKQPTPVKTLSVQSPAKRTSVKSEETVSKQTPSKSHDPAVPTDSVEKPKGSAYRGYLTRGGPTALGSKEIPTGQENCMEGLTFVITGVLDSIERDEARSQIERYGGKVTGSISKKTSYVVVGREAGESKLAKAKQFGTKEIDEDGLFELIKTLPGKKSKYEIQAEEAAAKEKASKPATSKYFNTNSSKVKSEDKTQKTETVSSSSQATKSPGAAFGGADEEALLWVDKFKPQSMKQIIGQQGDKSNAKKLLRWLTSWHANNWGQKAKAKAWGTKDEWGVSCKAALLSGPPGVGKTTTATLVCKEAGFSFVELNASDTRSKKSLQQEVALSVDNHTLVDFFGKQKQSSDVGQKHCLIMDEIDGMAGNEDRGGLAEVVNLIKTSKIPIICMCNDRNNPKMRTLSNYCFDLRFQKPRVEQIKGAMMSLAFKAGIKVTPPILNEIILGANQDVRQVIHNLEMWSAGGKALTFDQAKQDAEKAKKDIKIGPFDVCRKVFAAGEETAHMTLIDKSDLFFNDYSIGPLFVQENYASVSPYAAKGDVKKHLDLLSQAADSIAEGDLVERIIRSSQNWSLLPTQAIYASVLPGEIMRGAMHGMIAFPGWLGKNSSRNKTDRIIQELRGHMTLKVSADKQALNLDYLPRLRRCLTEPLIQQENEGIPEVIDLIEEYDLVKEDFDNILEVTQWPGRSEPMKQINSKVKAAFTRTYNKGVHHIPYAQGTSVKKGGRGGASNNDDLLGEEGETVTNDSDQEDDDISKDMSIKAITKPRGKDKGTATTSKGKGRGKGKS